MDLISNSDETICDGSNWVFIIGSFRTGTTALVKILNSHDSVCCLNEMWLWGYVQLLSAKRIYLEDLRKDNNKITNLSDYLCFLKNSQLYNCMQEQYNYSEPGQISFGAIRSFMEGVRNMAAPNAMVFGDKRGGYRYILDDLRGVFPNCRLLLTTRNLWDHAASIYDKEFQYISYDQMPTKNVLKLCLCIALNCKNADRAILKQQPNIHVVDFDKMSYNIDREIVHIMEYLEIDMKYFDSNIITDVHYQEAENHYLKIPELIKIKDDLENHFVFNGVVEYENICDIKQYLNEEYVRMCYNRIKK